MGYFQTITDKLFGYNDGTRVAPGLDRVQIGNLDAYTDAIGHTSDAGPGIRVLDAAGLLLMDALGLIGQFESLGFAANGINQSQAGVSFADVTGSSFVMQVKRNSRIVWPFSATGKITAGANNGLVRGVILKDDGTTWDTTANIIIGTSAHQTAMLWYFAGKGATNPYIPKGTYTVKLQMGNDNAGTTLNVVQFFHQIFLCGG